MNTEKEIREEAAQVAAILKSDDNEIKKTAWDTIGSARFGGKHILYLFAEICNNSGWGRSKRKAVSMWYTDRNEVSTISEIEKTKSFYVKTKKGMFSHADIIRYLSIDKALNAGPSRVMYFKNLTKNRSRCVGARHTFGNAGKVAAGQGFLGRLFSWFSGKTTTVI